MRLSNGFVIDKEKTFGELKFTAVRDVFLQNEDGTPSTQLKKRIYDLKCRHSIDRVSLTSVLSFKRHKKQGRHSERRTDQRQRELPVPMSDQPQLQPFQSRVRKKCRK